MSARAVASIVDVIGATPMVALSRMAAGLQGTVFAKLDYLNPGFSKKDRIARQIIVDAKESGELLPGVIELFGSFVLMPARSASH
jgi:cysteine synthase A